MVKIVMGKKPAMGVPPIQGDSEGVTRRLKILEERLTTTRNKIQVLEQNMLHKQKSAYAEAKTQSFEITELKKEVNEVRDKILILVKELEQFAKKEEVGVLKRYIDFWNPIRFVSKNEVEDVVRQAIEKIRKE
ncbi:hypothetical protein J4401_03455 [Candidatus Woesearchaeota archaeon]|nr:hypothetical protein [Candidatus Woesearchaeota archaeon]